MPKRIILRATRNGKRGLVLSKDSVRELRKFDRTKRGIATNDQHLADGYYDAEPILTPISIKGQKFYIQPKADKRAVIPSSVIKKANLHSGRISFVVREPKRGEVIKSRGFFQKVRTKNIFKTRYYLQSVEDVNLGNVKKSFFIDMANFPKGMMSVYGRLAFVLIADNKELLPLIMPIPTLSSGDFALNPKETRDLIFEFVDDAFDKMFAKLLQDYVVDIYFIYSEVSHFRDTSAGEIKNVRKKGRK